MLAHSRGSTGERRRVDVNALVEEALNLAYYGARAEDQSFNIAFERDLDQTMAPIELARRRSREFFSISSAMASMPPSNAAARRRMRPITRR
jgi:hypothetical protein